MEYKYKFTLSEYARALMLLADNDPRKILARKILIKAVVGAIVLLNIIYLIVYGLKVFLILGAICSIILILFFYFIRSESTYKRILKDVTKQADRDPEILNWKSIKFEGDSIIYNFNNKTLITKLIRVGKVIEKDNIILILDSSDDLCAIIPCSYFKDILGKEEFLNKVNSIL